jgi:hypothetical protein
LAELAGFAELAEFAELAGLAGFAENYAGLRYAGCRDMEMIERRKASVSLASI